MLGENAIANARTKPMMNGEYVGKPSKWLRTGEYCDL
jgi:hypothetical protein